jgi:hypothetical protein
MSRAVPSWVYRRQLDALRERSFSHAAPAVEESREQRADPVSARSRARLGEAEVELLLNVDWGEVRRLVKSGRLP